MSMSSDEEDRSFSFKPLSGSLALKKKVEASSAAAASEARSPQFSSASQIADKYQPKPTPTAAAAEAVSVEPPSNTPKLPFPRPSGSTGSPVRKEAAAAAAVDESVDSINPGSRSPMAASNSSNRNQPGAAASASVASPVREELRYSYLDPNGGHKLQTRLSTESSPSSDEESLFSKTVKPLIGASLWDRSIAPAGKRAKSPFASLTVPEEEEKYEARGSPERPTASEPPAAAAAAGASPAPPMSTSFQGQHNLSAEFQALQQAWVQQEEENQQLKADLKQHQQAGRTTLQPAEAQQRHQAHSHSTPSRQSHPHHLQVDRPPLVSSPSFFASDLDALSALQLAHESDRAANEAATRAFLTNDSYYPPSVELHEVLADHKRLRQRLRAAQHAIEALAAHTEVGALDGAASLAAQVARHGSASSMVSPPARRGYMPAMQSPPSALSMSQYAHLPPARAVLKLLTRLEREEETYMSDRAAWKAEKLAIGRQMSALTADLRHLTSLAQQSQLNEEFFRRREGEHEETLVRLKGEREAERARWAEIERELRENALRERMRFNSDVAKLERNSGHFKEKYDAVLTVLRRYEHERSVPPSVAGADVVHQQKKLFTVLSQEADSERAALAEQLARQEQRFLDLSNAQALADANREAELKELREQMARETQRRLAAEKQVTQTQQVVTRSLDEKLQALQAIQHPAAAPRAPLDQQRERASAEVMGEEIARAYAADRERQRAHERRADEAQRAHVEAARGRSRDRARVSAGSSLSGRSVSPPRAARSSSRGRRSHGVAHFRPDRVASVREILSQLPDDAQVRGDIEFVLPEDGRSAPYYRAHSERTRDRDRSPHYTRPTYSSDHAAALAERQFHPKRDRSRSYSPTEPRTRSREARRPSAYPLADEHVADVNSAQRRARSHSRTSRSVSGGVPRSSSSSRPSSRVAPVSSRPSRPTSGYEYDRYGRVSRARVI